MELHQVRYFLALYEEQNFTRAAKRCQVSQPSLTNAIKRLEQNLGGLLFHRKRGNIQLSELGRVVLPHFKQINQCAQTAERQAAEFYALNINLVSYMERDTPMRKYLYLAASVATVMLSLGFVAKSMFPLSGNLPPQQLVKISLDELHQSVDRKALLDHEVKEPF